MNGDHSFRGDSVFFLQSMRATRWNNLKLSQIHFGYLNLTKLIRPRLLSANRKLRCKKSLLYPYLPPHFSGKLCSTVQKKVENALTNKLDWQLGELFCRIRILNNLSTYSTKKKESPKHVNHGMHVY